MFIGWWCSLGTLPAYKFFDRIGMDRLLVWLTFLWVGYFFSLSSCQNGAGAKELEQVRDSVDTLCAGPDTVTVHLMAVGDLMAHRWQMERAYNRKDSTFDFSCAFASVKPHFDQSDYLVGNLETTFAGRNKGRAKATFGYSCFPFFNAPEAFGSELKEVGFDLLSTINNHSLDSRVSGLRSTLDWLDSLGVKAVGTASMGEEKGRSAVVDVKGVKLGFYAFTMSLNGFTLPDSLAYSVNMIPKIDNKNMARLRSDISDLKKQGTDAVVAIVHFGTEYQRKPNKEQRDMVDSLFAYGVDVVLGSHPHILQEMETRVVVREDSVPHQCVAFYSLGNFISCQRWKPTHNLSKDLGVIADIELQKIDGFTQVNSVTCKPTYTYWHTHCIGVVPVFDALADSLLYSTMNDYDRKRLHFAVDEVPGFLFPKEMTVDTLGNGYLIDLKKQSRAEIKN